MISSQQLGKLLVEVEDNISIPVLPRHGVGPQLLHEEHLVRELGCCPYKHTALISKIFFKTISVLTVTCWTSFLDPVSQVTNKIKEEVTLGNTDHLVRDLDKQTESFAGSQVQPLCNVLTEILGSG